MKRLLGLILVVVLLAAFAVGCGEKDRIMFGSVKLSDFVELPEYKGLEVDTSSDDFKEVYDSIIESDVESYELYVKKTEGTVADGDTVNIDYEGKKDGVAFEGGTAEGYDLEIGSNSFIDGFESGLIGVAIGDTVDLNLTFPESYSSTELAGQAVVFTVTVNYVKTDEALAPEDYYQDLDFKTLKEYEADVKDRAVKTYLLEIVLEKSSVKDYPKADVELLTKELTAMLERNLQSYYGVDLQTYMTQSGMTQDTFNTSLLEEQVYPQMEQIMPLYAILDEEKLEVTSEDITNKINETVKEYGSSSITAEDLTEYYGEYYFENMLVSDKAAEIIVENAKIK